MLPHRERPRCSLHIVIPPGDLVPDTVGLADALSARLDDIVVLAWNGGGGDVDFGTAARAADVIDDLTARTRLRTAYAELHGELGEALERHLDATFGTPVVSIAAGSPRRALRSARRAATRAGAHFALVPRSADLSEDPVAR